MRRAVLFLAALLIVFGCAVSIVGIYFLGNRAIAVVTGETPAPRPTAGTGEPGLTTAPVPNPTNLLPTAPVPGPTSVLPTSAATTTLPSGSQTLSDLLSIQVPRNDPLKLAESLRKRQGGFATPAAPKLYRAGDQTTFWVSREITGTYQLITATLRYVTPHSYTWVENGETVDDSALKSAGDQFENHVYPTDRRYFGSEWTPGIDGDPHVYILDTHFVTTVAGYYSSADEYPTFVNRFSNQHEIFYMNLANEHPGSLSYEAVLAHEFTHMIHWNENKREGSWITEGFGDLGMKLNGFPQDVSGYVQNPDLQLDAWAETGSAIPHYQEAYLFLSYLLNRFGDNFIRDMVQSGTHDLFTIQKALDDNAPGLKADDVFGDWVVANFADDTTLGPRYSYTDNSLGIKPQASYSNYPQTQTTSVHQYGSDYYQLNSPGHDVTFAFQGAQSVRIIPTDPHSGKRMWWGNRVDESDTTLTHEFDLTGLTKATLNFWTWYDIEAGFDYGYVEVSTDGGTTWGTLPGKTTTSQDPNGQNYGNGLTCRSMGGCDPNGPPAQWVQEQMDLTPYAGRKVLVRFEYITDAVYSGPGFAIDDISIPELKFSDGAENGDNGWQAQGFARIDNSLPQSFIVQAIEYGANGQVSRIVPVTLDSNRGNYKSSGLGSSLSKVVIAISGDTPITWEEAQYQYTVQ